MPLSSHGDVTTEKADVIYGFTAAKVEVWIQQFSPCKLLSSWLYWVGTLWWWLRAGRKKTHKLSSMQFHMFSRPPDGCFWDVHYNNCVNLRRNWTKELESSLTFSMICKHRARFQHTTLIGLPHLDPKKGPRSLTFVLDSSGGKTINFQRNLTLLHLGWSKTRGGVILQLEHVLSCRRSNY